MTMIWFISDQGRLRMILYSVTEVPDVGELYRAPVPVSATRESRLHTKLVQSFKLTSEELLNQDQELERLRSLTSAIYSYRKESAEPLIRTFGFSRIWSGMEDGQILTCGYMSKVVRAILINLGYRVRGVRWSDPTGIPQHTGLEIYSTQFRKWFYYDVNLNGGVVNSMGVPFNAIELRNFLAQGQEPLFTPISNERDWDEKEFVGRISKAPFPFIDRLDDLSYFEPEHRFGVLNALYSVLDAQPYVVGRAIDVITGNGDRMEAPDGGFPIKGILGAEYVRLVAGFCLLALLGSGLGFLMSRRKRSKLNDVDHHVAR